MVGKAAPSHEAVRFALALACRAPSVHNSQPWRWELTDHAVHLYADPSRLLTALDPTGREMVTSCGAALHHAQVAFAADGWHTTIHRLPNPADPDHLASLEFNHLAASDPNIITLASVAADRRTDRRPFLPDPVPDDILNALCHTAGLQGATLTIVREYDRRRELEIAIDHAGRELRKSPEYQQELTLWTRRHASDEGVPAHNIPEQHTRGISGRDFGTGELAIPILDDGAALGILTTPGDTAVQWISAGEALSAVLLTATQEGLATCPLSQISEVDVARDQVRERVVGTTEVPQLAVRVGWPVTGEFPSPLTPRRALTEVVHRVEYR